LGKGTAGADGRKGEQEKPLQNLKRNINPAISSISFSRRHMRHFYIILISFAVLQSASCQDILQQAFVSSAEWGAGSIILINGKELNGLVKYNDVQGIVSFDGGNQSKSFTARNILGFELFSSLIPGYKVFVLL